MPELKLEVTEELMRQIEAAAKESLVTPSHWATCKIKDIFFEKKDLNWLLAVPPILRNFADTLEHYMSDINERQ